MQGREILFLAVAKFRGFWDPDVAFLLFGAPALDNSMSLFNGPHGDQQPEV